VALALAQRCGAEVVNADSRQVYRRLDIGSAKPTREERAAVPHHVVDIVEPDEPFDCARFRQLATAAIDDITRRGKRVLVVGGTGLYIRVLLHGLFTGPPRDAARRDRLLRAERDTPGVLHQRLRAVDPLAAARLHPNDHVRLVRALEVYELTGRPISAWQADHAFAGSASHARVVGLTLPRPQLYARIEARCHAMVRQGLAEEVQRLYANGFDATLPALRSPGYREIGEYVRGLCDLPTAIGNMATATRHLAKRQLTWFRADPGTVWCAPDVTAVAPHAEAFWAARR